MRCLVLVSDLTPFSTTLSHRWKEFVLKFILKINRLKCLRGEEKNKTKQNLHSQEPPFKRFLLSSLAKTRGYNSCESILIQALHALTQTEWRGHLRIAWAQADGNKRTLHAKLSSQSACKAVFAGHTKRRFLLSAWVQSDSLSLSCMW